MRNNKIVRWCLLPLYVFVLSVFLLSDPVFGAVTDSASSRKPAGDKDSSSASIDNIAIPEDIGLVKDVYKGKSDKFIVHIQDAHCNYEAQSNIFNILDMLMRTVGLVLVAVEGSAGKIDTSLFNTFPDDDIKREVATYFMKKGKISGAESFAINTKSPVILYGVENKEYYLENLRAFTETLPARERLKKACGETRAMLARLKGYVYNKELKDFDGKVTDYDANRMKFVDFCVYLNSLASGKAVNVRAYENFSHLMRALEMEKNVEFNKVDKERADVINVLEKRLPQDQLSDFFMKSLSYKTKKITSSEYYLYLRGLAEKNGIKFSEYKNLDAYIDYLASYSKIDNQNLFRELKALEGDVKETLFTNDDQRRLSRLYDNAKLLDNVLDIALSKEDAAYLRRNIDAFKAHEFSGFIRRQASKYGLSYVENPDIALMDKALPTLGNFYDMAEKREDAIVENTIKKMEEENFTVSALISGGYHTEGLTELFKKHGISYVVISPRITTLDAKTPYLQILAGEEIPFEKILEED